MNTDLGNEKDTIVANVTQANPLHSLCSNIGHTAI